jgi:hypothetical protein
MAYANPVQYVRPVLYSVYTSLAAQQRSKLANLLNAPANIISQL